MAVLKFWSQPLEECRAAGLGVELLVVEEQAWVGMIRNVLEHDIDLVVVGKRSAHAEHVTGLGSVTTKLIRKCPCLVWAVRPGAAHHPENILATTDLGNMGVRVLDVAKGLRDVWNTELHVFHSFQLTMANHHTHEGTSSEALKAAAEAKRQEVRGADGG